MPLNMQQELQRTRIRSYFVSTYGYATSAVSTKGQYHEDIKNMVEFWFEKVRDIANNEGISDVKTDIFIDVKSIIESIIESIIDYANQTLCLES